jgi:hypothetical protein
LWFQQRSNTKDATISGGATVNLNGVIYMANTSSKLTFSGGSSSGTNTLYTILVVQQLILGGGGNFHNDFSSIGGSPLPGGSALIE